MSLTAFNVVFTTLTVLPTFPMGSEVLFLLVAHVSFWLTFVAHQHCTNKKNLTCRTAQFYFIDLLSCFCVAKTIYWVIISHRAHLSQDVKHLQTVPTHFDVKH